MIRKNIINFIEGIDKEQKTGIASFVHKFDTINIRCILKEIDKNKESYLYIEKPQDKTKILAWSPLSSFTFSGIDRIANTEKAVSEIRNNFVSNWSEFPEASLPLFLGGIKFHPDNSIDADNVWSDYKDSEWFIPSYAVCSNISGNFLIYNFKIEGQLKHDVVDNLLSMIKFCENFKEIKEEILPEIDSSFLNEPDDFEKWELNVKKALNIIEQQDAEKIVLSRRVKRELSCLPKVPVLIARLASQYPGCHTFAYRKGESVFFGASPERLASISKGWIEADALAGSSPRGENDTLDKSLEEKLINSKKNLNEQKAVVDFIAGSFRKFTDEINYPEKPVIRKLPNIQHLWTPIKAKLSKGCSVFSLLKEIHPTPAICGVPWNKALSFINDSEPHNRGLYAGILGWFNFENEGEFVVALRSGLLKNKTLYAFAGCGIVKGSNPKSEYEESELKLKPVLSQFRNEKKG